MSDHDPFDGIYTSTSVHAESDKADQPAPEQKVESVDNKPVDTVYSSPFLRRQDKADLQKIARDKGLSTSGTRDDLIERIEDDQNS